MSTSCIVAGNARRQQGSAFAARGHFQRRHRKLELPGPPNQRDRSAISDPRFIKQLLQVVNSGNGLPDALPVRAAECGTGRVIWGWRRADSRDVASGSSATSARAEREPAGAVQLGQEASYARSESGIQRTRANASEATGLTHGWRSVD